MQTHTIFQRLSYPYRHQTARGGELGMHNFQTWASYEFGQAEYL